MKKIAVIGGGPKAAALAAKAWCRDPERAEIKVEVFENLQGGGETDEGLNRPIFFLDAPGKIERGFEAGRLCWADTLDALQLHAGGVCQQTQGLELEQQLPPQVERAPTAGRVTTADDECEQLRLAEGGGSQLQELLPRALPFRPVLDPAAPGSVPPTSSSFDKA